MRWAVPFVLATACSSEPEPRELFAGDYETAEYALRAGCSGPETPATIADGDRYFRLADETLGGQPIVAYYECSAPSRCDDVYDLSKTVGRGPEGLSLHIAIGGGTPCKLTFRKRTLTRTASGVQYSIDVHQQTDDTVAADQCTSDEARRRATAMPCVEQRLLRATKR